MRVLVAIVFLAGCSRANQSLHDFAVADENDLAAASDLAIDRDGGDDEDGGVDAGSALDDASANGDAAADAGVNAADFSAPPDLRLVDFAPEPCDDVDAGGARCFGCLYNERLADGGLSCIATHCSTEDVQLGICAGLQGCCGGSGCASGCITSQCPSQVRSWINCVVGECEPYIDVCR